MKVIRKKLTRSFGGNLTVLAVLIVSALFMSMPLIYIAFSAFKPFDELFLFPPRFIVARPTLDNFTDLFILSSNSLVPFTRYLFNSVFVTSAGTAGYVIFASMAAYPLAKHKFPGGKLLYGTIFAAILFNSRATFIPQYIIMARLGWIDTYLPLIVPAFGMALSAFMMKLFMEQIPTAMLESARIDGASEYKIFWSVVMPTVKPAWLTLVIFGFQNIWNNYGTSFIYDESLKLLPAALKQISSGGIARFGVGAAAMLIIMLPPIAVFLYAQGSVIESLAHVGIKE